MYVQYKALFGARGVSNAYTDSTRFACISLPSQENVRRSIYSNEESTQNIPCTHDTQQPVPPQCQYKDKQPKQPIIEEFQKNTQIPVYKEEQQTPKSAIKTTFQRRDPEKLLPVMSPVFNMREICKQCILLEDHLSHTEKRCTDCCIKHFLTIEALAEEAITLDKKTEMDKTIHTLPQTVRDLQKLWYEDPEKNAHAVSQKLREIRKQFQIDSFSIIFMGSDCETCTNGVCPIKKN